MTYRIKLKKGVKRDLKKIKGTYLEPKLKAVVDQLRIDPYAPTQSFEKLVPPIRGYYSRRLNVQHRLVYRVNEMAQEVVIYSAWGHYE